MKVELGAKHKSISSLNIIKKSLRYYFLEIRYSKVYFASIITFIVVSKLSRFIVLNEKLKFDSDTPKGDIKMAFYSTTLGEVLDILFFKTYDYLTDIVFAKHQANVSVKAFRNLVYDINRNVDITSGRLQYFINVGSKAMGKLVTSVSFLIIAEILQMAMTFYFTGYRNCAICIPVLLICFVMTLFLHVRVTEMKLMCKKRANSSLVSCDKALYEAFLNIDVIKSSSMEEYEIAKYHRKLKAYEDVYIEYGRIEDTLDFLQTFLFSIVKLLLFLYLYSADESDDKDLGKRIRVINTVFKSVSLSVFTTGSIYRKIKESLLNSRLVLEYISDSVTYEMPKSSLENFGSRLEFRCVDIFVKSMKILHNLSFEISRGKKIALIGKNGLGKSTIFKTMLGLQQYTGNILIDDIPIETVDVNKYRSLFAYIPQNNFLFDETIYYNITYGSSNVSKDVVEDVSEKLNLHSSIMKMKSRYDSKVGERGEFLSGGIRQKIIIARAFLRNAEIFLFDEPFNNLDKASSENLVNLVFGDAFANKTVVMIIHNHEMLDKFDDFICIDQYAHSTKTASV